MPGDLYADGIIRAITGSKVSVLVLSHIAIASNHVGQEVVNFVEIVRQHLIQVHSLRLSNKERAQKTAALYHFITSQPCTDLLDRIDNNAEDLLDLQATEQRAHELTWRKQGELIRSVQKARADLCNHIETIIGPATSAHCAACE